MIPFAPHRHRRVVSPRRAGRRSRGASRAARRRRRIRMGRRRRIRRSAGWRAPARGDEFRIDAALEAIARIRNDAELAPGRRRARRVEIGAFDEDVGGGVGAARCLRRPSRRQCRAPPYRRRSPSFRDRAHRSCRRARGWFRRRARDARARCPKASPSSKTCSGLPRSSERRFVTSTSAEIGRKPTALKSLLQPRGRGAVFHAADHAPGEHRTGRLCTRRENRARPCVGDGKVPLTGATAPPFSVPMPAAARSRAMP